MSIGAWEPLWLDPGSRCLYAALHPGRPEAGLPGVLLAPPLLHEQPRSRRFIAEVASGLAARGLPCLRFDYFGTGDSAGTGDQLDFASMRADLSLAAAALRSRTGVDRVVLLAWRAAALAADSWLGNGGHADLLVLWEPITDGASWLRELEHDDASEREHRPRMRPGLRRTALADDGQLMGFEASPRFRRELARMRLVDGPRSGRVPTWAVVRETAPPMPIEVARLMMLPAGAATFNGRAAMEETFFLSPPLERVVDELGQAMLEQGFHEHVC